MRECQLKNAGGECKEHGVVCLSCKHFVNKQKGIIVDHPASIQNDNGSSDLSVRHQTIKRMEV